MNTGNKLPAVMLGVVCGALAGAVTACTVRSMCSSPCRTGAMLIKAGRKMNRMKNMF